VPVDVSLADPAGLEAQVKIGELRGHAVGSARSSGVLSVKPKRRSAPPTLILQLNPDDTILFANEMFELVFGWHHGELKGLYAWAILRPNDIVRDSEPEHWQLYDEVRGGTRESAEFETHLEARDGHVVRLALMATRIRHLNFVQIEAQVLSDEPVLRDHRVQFADPLERMALGDFLEAERQRQMKELASRVDGFEQHLLELRHGRASEPKNRQGHRPSNPVLNTREKFIAALEDAIRTSHDVWHPTRREVCDKLGAKSENSLKDWLQYYELLQFDSAAKTLNAIAENLLLRDASQER
jgi:PAS domain S-box-containing protein